MGIYSKGWIRYGRCVANNKTSYRSVCHCFAAMVAETELFWGGGLFNMIRWVICVIGIVVDNLGCCRIWMK